MMSAECDENTKVAQKFAPNLFEVKLPYDSQLRWSITLNLFVPPGQSEENDQKRTTAAHRFTSKQYARYRTSVIVGHKVCSRTSNSMVLRTQTSGQLGLLSIVKHQVSATKFRRLDALRSEIYGFVSLISLNL